MQKRVLAVTCPGCLARWQLGRLPRQNRALSPLPLKHVCNTSIFQGSQLASLTC